MLNVDLPARGSNIHGRCCLKITLALGLIICIVGAGCSSAGHPTPVRGTPTRDPTNVALAATILAGDAATQAADPTSIARLAAATATVTAECSLTDVAVLNRVLVALGCSRTDKADLAALVGFLPPGCVAADVANTSTDTGCGVASATADGHRVFTGGCDSANATTVEGARQVIDKTLGEHAAWSIEAVVKGGETLGTHDGYVIALRAATGNFGSIWYVSGNGLVVGVDSCGATVNRGLFLQQLSGLDYLYGPHL